MERGTDTANWKIEHPVTICLLGTFRVLRSGGPVVLRGSKAAALLTGLAVRRGYRADREVLLELLWPESDSALASQSLNSLVYSVNRLFDEPLGGVPAVHHRDGAYYLNTEAGLDVDVARFDALTVEADRLATTGARTGAASAFRQAVALYHGDLVGGNGLDVVVERERLRAKNLNALGRLADYAFGDGDLGSCLDYADRLLAIDPCREDAHRLVMRCFACRGERAQALRQYQFCAALLRREYDAAPEPATIALYEQVRSSPGSLASLSEAV